MTRLALLLSVLTLAGCAGSSAQVVSSSGGPSIQAVQAQPYNGPMQRIAVSSFEFQGSAGGVGAAMSDMLTDALVNSGRFIVLERQRLNEVTAEQDLANSGRFKKETAAPIGQLEGAQLLVRGSVTQFEPDCKGGSILIASAKTACIAINIRIIEAATGRVVNATTVTGTSANTGVGFVYTKPTLPVGLGAWSKTPMEQALRNCIETAVAHIVATKT